MRLSNNAVQITPKSPLNAGQYLLGGPGALVGYFDFGWAQQLGQIRRRSGSAAGHRLIYPAPVPNTLVECVPNFSEGRDKANVDAIVEAMKMDGVYLLDREMDADHNRCVITLVGDREVIQRPRFAALAKLPTDRSDEAPGRASAHGSGGRDSVHPHRRRHPGGLCGDCAARGRGDLEAIQDSGLSLRGGGADCPSVRTWRTFAAGSLKAFARTLRPTRRASPTSARRRTSNGRRNGCGRAQISGRVQRFPQYGRRGDREEDRQGGALLERRTALREGHGRSGARAWRRSR